MKKKINFRASVAVAIAVIVMQVVFVGGPILQTKAQTVDDGVSASAPADSGTVVTGDSTADSTVAPDTSVSTDSTSQTSAPADSSPVSQPTLSTDKDDYHPAENVSILGRFFTALQDVVLRVFGGSTEDGNLTDTSASVIADEFGSFTFNHQLSDSFVADYTVTASTISGIELARATFTDSLPTDFAQCSNNNSPNPAGSCNWIGSIIQQSNSVYAEGMTVPQRLLFRDFVGSGPHSITFTYQYTKAGIHAYDFLATVDPTVADPNSVQGNSFSSPGTAILNPCANLTGPDLTACNGLTPTSTAKQVPVPVPSDAYISHDGPQSSRESAYVTNYGSRFIQVYAKNGSATFTSPTVSFAHSVANSADTSDSQTAVTLSFTVPSGQCTSGSKCNFLLYFGGHLALSGDGTGDSWGAGKGSSQISGGPYHIKDVKFDGVGGSQDNQIKGADIIVPPQQTATLTVIKHVVNDNGGTAVAGNWTMNVAAVNPSSSSFPGVEVSGTTITVDAGAYSVSESGGPSGYTPSLSTDCSGNIAAGEAKTCTITNDDQGATLHVVKVVDNGNTGATTGPSAFSFHVNGGNAQSFESDGTNDLAVSAGTYSVTEPAVSGYSTSYNNCSNVVVPNGGSATCTVTNTAIAPTLTLVKTVVNDNGGQATTADFQGKIDGTSVAWSSAQSVSVGSHTASEVANVSGYSASVWGADCAANGSVTLALGETKTCTITNDDQPAHLILVKHLPNDNGGTATQSNFTPSIDNVVAVWGDNTVNAGSHSASETNLPGYTPSGWSNGCLANGSVTLALGETKTCEITNDDIAPKLHLRKVVVNDNGGPATVASFTLTADGAGANDLSGTSPVDSGAGLKADTFVLSETNVSGYTASAWSCVGGTQNSSNITLGLGGEATCTITNDDIQPRLIVIKNVINDDGDVAIASDFTMTVTGSSTSLSSFQGNASGTTVTLNAGAYSADETDSRGYVKTLGTDCVGTIAVGETKTCTITNNDIPHATRTQGFWQTHTAYTTSVFGTSTVWGIGTHNINSTPTLFAGFYASISKKAAGGKRSALDQARMQMLQQWLAAELNCKAFGCSATTTSLIASSALAWGNNATPVATILSYASQLDAYNNSNDALPISGQGKATPGASQTLAGPSLWFWDLLP